MAPGARLTASTSKKAILERFDREPLSGFVNPRTYLQPNGVELLSVSGTVALIPYAEIKAICFVREFQGPGMPERRVFHTRPKAAGLWVRLHFRDGECLEGLLANNLMQLETAGFHIAPPEAASNTQRLFVPRAALKEVQVLGVIGSPLRPRSKPKVEPRGQIKLFE